MKTLIEQYLLIQGILVESYSIQFLRFTTKIYKDKSGGYVLEFPKWNFDCPRPIFSSEEIEESLKSEYVMSHTDGIENKYFNDEATKQVKIDQLNALTDLTIIKNFIY